MLNYNLFGEFLTSSLFSPSCWNKILKSTNWQYTYHKDKKSNGKTTKCTT